MQSRDNTSNLKEAFDLAEEHLNVPRLLEPEGQFTNFPCNSFQKDQVDSHPYC